MTFTRRTFMETTCALSAGLVFGSLAHASTKVPEKWDETCSLLIIGTGFAGLGAALESHYLGMKDILVVDKMPSAGGNSIIKAVPSPLPEQICRKKPESKTMPIFSTRTF